MCISYWPDQHARLPTSTYFKPAGLAYNSFCRSKPPGSVAALIDSSATHSFVSPEIVQQNGLLLETRD